MTADQTAEATGRPLPWSGRRMLDLGRIYEGPWSGTWWGRSGAIVVKIEESSGEPVRRAVAFGRDEYPAHGQRRQRALERPAAWRRELRTARLICFHAACLARRGVTNALEASYAKLYAPSVVFRAASTPLDLQVEAGVRNDAMLEKLYRNVKILDIGEGTQQVRGVVVGRQFVGFARDP